MNQRQKYIDKVLSGKTKYAQRTKLKLLDEKIHGVTPQIFASFALVLNEKHKWNPDDIEDLFTEVMNTWDDFAERGENMCKYCEEVTGIDVEGANV